MTSALGAAQHELVDGSKRRLQQVADIVQDVVLIFVLALIVGSLIEAVFFPERLEHIQKHSTLTLTILVVLQLIINAVAIFYLVLIVNAVPKVIQMYPQYSGTSAAQAASTAVIGLVFVGAQTSLLARIAELCRRFRL